MTGSYIPGEVIASGYGVLAAAVVALAVFGGRLRERIARVEEWQRINEQWETDDDPDDEPGSLSVTFPRG